MRRPALFLLLAASLLLGGAARARADADAPRLLRYPTGVIHPGDVVELEWTKGEGGVDELEVVLAVDDRFTIRVTPEIEGDRLRWSWKVPDLAAAHARLAVRYGEEDEERLSAPTPAFRIEPAPTTEAPAPAVRRVWVSGPARPADWWDEADAPPVRAADHALAGGETLAPCDAPARGATLPSRSDDADARLDRPTYLPRGEAVAAPVTARQCPAAFPRLLPLRE